MDININCTLAAALAQQVRAEREELTHRWLERIAARVTLDANRIFPTDELLDHVPILVDGIAAYLENPADEITADAPVVAKAMELGELRFGQGFGAHEVLKEYEILGGVLFAFLIRVVDRIEEACTRGELLACAHRLFRSISVIQSATTMQYLRLANEQVREREDRLRSFNSTVSHELKNRIGAVRGAAQMLQEEWVQADPEQRTKFARIAEQNADAMHATLEDLIVLSRTDTDARRQRNVLLPEAVAEVVRQLREAARARGVVLRTADDLPEIEVNAAAVELCLTNYVSNGIKYADLAKPERWVQVEAQVDRSSAAADPPAWLVIRVRDNGLGVPPDARSRLFQRFFRAHADSAAEVDGTGLGLSIVRETVEALGGRASAEFDGDDGATFTLALPIRRTADRE